MTMLFKRKLKMLFKHEFWPADDIMAKSRELEKERKQREAETPHQL